MKLISFEATDRDFDIWRRGLADLSLEELDNGVKKARDYDGNWFSLNVFRNLCRFSNEDLGLPTAREAYYEACLATSPKEKYRWSHPIVYMAGCSAGWFELQNQPESKMLKRFEHFYEVLVHRVRNGEKFKVQPALEDKQYDGFVRTPEEHLMDMAQFNNLKQKLKSEVVERGETAWLNRKRR